MGGAKSKGEPEILGGATGFPTDIENMEGLCPPPLLGGSSSKFDVEGLKSIHGGSMGGLKAVEKYLWRSSFDSKVASYKPASL